MSYPALTDLATFILVLAVGIPSVFIFSKALKLHPQTLSFTEKKKQSLLAMLVFVGIFIGAFAIYGFYDRIWVRATLTADPIYVLRDVIAVGVLLLPVLIALKFSKQDLTDIALTRKDIGKSAILGGLVSSVLLFFLGLLSPYLRGGFAGFTDATVYMFLSYVILALGEEIAFRGYIQTRIVNHIGPLPGLGLSSLLYAAYNFPLGYFCFSGDITLALIYGAWRFSSGLVYGYTFHKSQNVLSSTIVHIFLVWGGLLFSLYL